MRAGLDYNLGGPTYGTVPSDEVLYEKMLSTARFQARQLRLLSPDEAASDAVITVVLDKRYQDRWKPGNADVCTWLYPMVQNKLLDIRRKQRRAHRWQLEAVERRGNGAPVETHWHGAQDYEPGTEDPRLADAETLATLEQLRRRVAHDPFFSELLDAVAGRALAGEPVTIKGLGEQFGMPKETVREALRSLRYQASSTLGG